MGEIDSKYIEKASEDLFFRQELQKGISVPLDYSRKFFWKTVTASVACTAAALFGVFVVLLNVGKIGIMESPESSDNSHAQSDVPPELPADAVLYDEAAYAYEWDNGELRRYAVGDKFGENTTIASAKATYKSVNGKPVLQKQEIVLDGELQYKMEGEIFISKDENNGVIWFSINIGEVKELGLPQFGDSLEIKTIYCSIADELFVSPSNVTIIDPTITVDHEAESITIKPSKIFLTDGINSNNVEANVAASYVIDWQEGFNDRYVPLKPVDTE